jgi:4-hydroxy-3-polyprenylbenzoate decarboxylase
MIKERRKLIVVPRETPLSSIHIENMLKLSKLGVVILPPSIAFYNKPKRVEEMVEFIVGKILDSLGVENELYKRWG